MTWGSWETWAWIGAAILGWSLVYRMVTNPQGSRRRAMYHAGVWVYSAVVWTVLILTW
jgi:hypothetical protein